jgi:hypothetical protein
MYVTYSPQSSSIAYSTNGIDWNLVSLNFPPYTLAFGNQKFVTASDYGQTYYSTDLINWTQGGQLEHVVSEIDYVNNKFFAPSEQYITSSTDGINWTTATNIPYIYGNIPIYGAGKYLVVSNPNYVYYSTDGESWTQGTSLYANLNKLINYYNGIFTVVNAQTGSTIYSTNGINWSYGQSWPQNGFASYTNQGVIGKINTLQQIQVSIGGQGADGSAETLVPVAVYTVPTGKTAKITEIKVNNLHSSAITYDLGKLSKGQTLTQAHSIKWDTALAGNSSDTITQVINMVAGDTITILPSSVNTVSVAIYGAESNA